MICKQIYPDDEFLPRAPDPDEIIIGGDNSEKNNETQEEQDGIGDSSKDNGQDKIEKETVTDNDDAPEN